MPARRQTPVPPATKPARSARPTSAAAPPLPRVRPALKAETLINLYAARRYLTLDAQEDVGLRVTLPVYFKDPFTAAFAGIAPLDEGFTTPWEPGLRDGPTSARFAVVDYDATNNVLTAPAKWDAKADCFRDPNGKALDHTNIDGPQFRQQSVWAIVQNTLDYFESGYALGRRISWAFEGSRLIVVPHAGNGENAYYDRASKSLQFYWFDADGGRIYTCLSSDIVNHEFAHAVLDGLRPLLFESVRTETAAFHEFMGDMTALLMAFRNNEFRAFVLQKSKGNLATDRLLSSLAGQFGHAVQGTPYLRSALNTKTMKDLEGNLEPHDLSEVLTGAMFDILRGVFVRLREAQIAALAAGERKLKQSDPSAFWDTVRRMQMLAIQPLDLLPPCGVTFKDYAYAILRHHQVSDPVDPNGIRQLMLDVFVNRGILTTRERIELKRTRAVFKRLSLRVFHPVDAIAASRGSAYRFLDDNREKLFIPPNADLEVAEVIHAQKQTTEGRLLPEQIVVQYTWREEVMLKGDRFGRFAGQRTSMLCGATMVLDQNGNAIHWARKPGSVLTGPSDAAVTEQKLGAARRVELLDTIAARAQAGMIGENIGSQFGLLGRACPPFSVVEVDGVLRFELVPHLSGSTGDSTRREMGARQWQINS